jgi:hypothetical protein
MGPEPTLCMEGSYAPPRISLAKPLLCTVSINAREMSQHIGPTAAVHARDFEHKLRPIQEALAAFERTLNNYANQDRRERARHDGIDVAVKLLQGALDALEMARN